MTNRNTDSPTLELTIQDVGYRGRGVGRDEGRVVFVPGVIEGERVRVRITHRHKRFADAELAEVIEPSPFRVAPGCPLALRASSEDGAPAYPCVGCLYQHMAYDEEVRMKQRQLESLLQRMAKLENVPLSEPVGSPHSMGYRNKIRLHGGTYKGKRVLGYVGANNHSVLDVSQCPLACDAINTRLAELRGEHGWIEGLRRSAEVTFRYTEADGVCESVRGVTRMKGELTEHSVLGDLTVPAGGFYQVNTAVADSIVEHVRSAIAGSDCGHVLDLYCGVGLFGLAAGMEGKAVWGVDSDERAVQCANQNAVRLLGRGEGTTESTEPTEGDGGVSFEVAMVERAVKEMLDSSPLDDTLVIVDPPRLGLDRSVTEALAENSPRELIYVSCAPDKLARDLVPLVASGYTIKEVKLFDMFPRTACFETVVRMSR
ncbi:MAG: class I SAM-dependent RNA methyltransferase [Kiritimatiellae bacterium]|nr:class I SAM-dependent RNA methyltransferase [Kiritimatiellia bacterium]